MKLQKQEDSRMKLMHPTISHSTDQDEQERPQDEPDASSNRWNRLPRQQSFFTYFGNSILQKSPPTAATGVRIGQPTSTAATGVRIGQPTSTAATGVRIGQPTSTAATGVRIGQPTSTAATGVRIGGHQHRASLRKKLEHLHRLKGRLTVSVSRLTVSR